MEKCLHLYRALTTILEVKRHLQRKKNWKLEGQSLRLCEVLGYVVNASDDLLCVS